MVFCGFRMYVRGGVGKKIAKKSCARAVLPLIKLRIEGLIAV